MVEEQNMQEPSIDQDNKAKATIKHILLLLLLLVLIVASFWFSFQLGKKILVPAKNGTDNRIEVAIPEVPAAIAELQEAKEKVAADQVKKPSLKPACQPVRPSNGFYKVQAGFFKDLRNANARKAVLRDKGFEVFIKKIAGGYRVPLGAFKKKTSATALRNKVTAKRIQAVVIFE